MDWIFCWLPRRWGGLACTKCGMGRKLFSTSIRIGATKWTNIGWYLYWLFLVAPKMSVWGVTIVETKAMHGKEWGLGFYKKEVFAHLGFYRFCWNVLDSARFLLRSWIRSYEMRLVVDFFFYTFLFSKGDFPCTRDRLENEQRDERMLLMKGYFIMPSSSERITLD
ncbi:hypothetical protein VTL71DRAFT_1576 [Oculimacula yallundae]|uniref:Uncharacterized protein n=1 Tax=Oculimacula yallundae TaxID=86028 RepID=A0ABR4CBX0_9HELO